LIVLSVVLLLVVIFALQNPQAVTIRFLLECDDGQGRFKDDQ